MAGGQPLYETVQLSGENTGQAPGEYNWRYLALQAMGTLVAGAKYGSDAGARYLGNGIGQGLAGEGYRDGSRMYQQNQADEQRRAALDAMAGEDAGWVEQNRLWEERNGAARAAAPSAGDAAPGASRTSAPLTPAQQAALDGGYGPLAPEAAERVAPDGVLASGPRPADAGEPTPASPPTPEESRAAFRRSETEYRNATSAFVQQGDNGVEPVAKRLAEANGEPDNWRAYVARAVKLNGLQVNDNGSPIVRPGQEITFGDSTLYSDKQLAMQNRLGGQIIAGNTALTQYNKEQAALAFAAQQQRAADNEFSREARIGRVDPVAAPVVAPPASTASTAASLGSASSYSDLPSQVNPEFDTAWNNEPSPERMRELGQKLKNAPLGAVETLYAGAHNGVVRIAGGLASIPYAIVGGADEGVKAQEAFKEAYGYETRSQGAKDIAQALQPVGQAIGKGIETARTYSESKIGVGATAILFTGTQAALEITATVTGMRSAGAFVEGKLASLAPDVTGSPFLADQALSRGAAGSGAAGARAVDIVAELPKLGVQSLDPTTVGFSQSWVSFNKKGATYDLDSMVNSMKNDGWVGKPIDAVLMPDGVITTIDNTRVLAARMAGIEVKANVRAFDEAITDPLRQLSLRENGVVPDTWGQAAQMRINKPTQNVDSPGWSQRFPFGSLYDPNVR